MENKEKHAFKTISKYLENRSSQKHNYVEAISAFLNIDAQHILCSSDNFSVENLFYDEDPFVLGSNLAICSTSEILASGGDPVLYSHSLRVSKYWNENFIDKFYQGVSSVLNSSKCKFIGGDQASSDDWYYNGICIGECIEFIDQIGCNQNDNIYLSGKIGSGNIQAAMCLYSDYLFSNLFKTMVHPKFYLRQNESKIIRKYATSCINTCDGLLNALNTLASQNNKGYHVNSIPYLDQCKTISTLLSKAIELFYIAESGEYELLFTIPDKAEDSFLKEAKENALQLFKIGKITSSFDRIIEDKNKRITFNDFDIKARNYSSIEAYLIDLDNFTINSEN